MHLAGSDACVRRYFFSRDPAAVSAANLSPCPPGRFQHSEGRSLQGAWGLSICSQVSMIWSKAYGQTYCFRSGLPCTRRQERAQSARLICVPASQSFRQPSTVSEAGFFFGEPPAPPVAGLGTRPLPKAARSCAFDPAVPVPLVSEGVVVLVSGMEDPCGRGVRTEFERFGVNGPVASSLAPVSPQVRPEKSRRPMFQNLFLRTRMFGHWPLQKRQRQPSQL